MYIVIEGQDATGKSTQVEMLAEYLRKQGKEVVTMHEPDGELEAEVRPPTWQDPAAC
jgi:dTMP kinase